MTDIYENGENIEQVAENDASYEKTEADEKTFTQVELEKLISERLRRERRNFEAFEDLKGAFDILSKTGVVEKASYSDMARMLGERIGGAKAEKDDSPIACAEKDAEDAEKSDTFAQEADREDKETGAAKKKDDAEKGDYSLSSVTLGDILSLEEKYPGENAALSVLSDSFRLFAEGRREKLSDIYEKYMRFEKSRGDKATDDKKTAPLRSSFSTGGVQTDYGASLTKRQMEIAREGGLSYREYADILGSLPGTGKITL